MTAIAVIMSGVFLGTFLMWMADAYSKNREINHLEAMRDYWMLRVRDAERMNHDDIANAYKNGVRDTHFKLTGEHLP